MDRRTGRVVGSWLPARLADRHHLDDAALAKAAAACSADCRPIDDKRGTIAYRTKVAGVLLKRTAAIAAKRAQGK